MAQRENCYDKPNKEDRRKDSKYDIGDMIEVKMHGKFLKTIVIYDKRQIRDKKGLYWVYDVFNPKTEAIEHSYPLIDYKFATFEKIA